MNTKKQIKQNDPQRKNGFLFRNRFFFGSFILLLLYNFVVVNDCTFPVVEGERYTFHLVDFSFGFCSKFLQGAVFNLFVKEPTELKATVYAGVFFVLFCAAVSLFIGKVSKAISEQYLKEYAVFVFFFITGPLTFSVFSYRLGMPDFCWVMITLLILICLNTPKLRFLIPVLSVAGVMIHFGFVITYLLFISAVIIYEAVLSDAKEEKKKMRLLFIVLWAVTIAALMFFLANDKKNLVYSQDEFKNLMSEKGVIYSQQLLYYLYGDPMYPEFEGVTQWMNSVIDPGTTNGVLLLIRRLLYTAAIQFKAYFVYGLENILMKFFSSLLFVSPVIICVFSFFKKNEWDGAEKKRARFCFLALFPLIIFLSLFVSFDIARWTAHALISLLALIFYMIWKEGDAVMEKLSEQIKTVNKPLLFLYAVLYFFTVFDPYTL